MGDDGVDDNGMPFFIGDVITLNSSHDQGFMIADGFNTTELIFKKQAKADLPCQWQICPKLNYQQQKLLNKAMAPLGLTDPTLLDDAFIEEHEVSEEERDAVMVRVPLVAKEREVNAAEEARMRGSEILYGMVVQLKHVRSGKFLSTTKGTGRQPGTYANEVIDGGDEGSWFQLLPGFKVRKEGDPVVVTDQVKLLSVKKSVPERGIYLHLNGADVGAWTEDGMRDDETEIHGAEEASKFTAVRFARYDQQGGDVVCSGAFARLMHKEEEAFITYGPVDLPPQAGSNPKSKSREKLHLLSVDNSDQVGDGPHSDSALTSSNAMFEMVQTDQLDVEILIERIRRKGKNLELSRMYPREVGGNVRWERLMRLRHVGTQKFLAASFVHEEGAKEQRYTRFYLADLEEEREDGQLKPIARAHLESLWNINPVNPLKDGVTELKLEDVFHLQHASTLHWVHAATDEADQAIYYDQPAKGRRRQRMLQLMPDKPYEDAFGFGPQDAAIHDIEVRDLNYIRTVLPELERYNKFVSSCATVTTSVYQPIKKLLTDLIVGFMTEGSQNLDPLTRVGLIKHPRRQQLLREQKLLVVLMEMSIAPVRDAGHTYGALLTNPKLQFIWQLSRLANKLIWHALRKNEKNCLYMIEMGFISEFQDQLSGQLGANMVLRELHLDNRSALERLPVLSFKKWVVMIEQAVKDGDIVGKLGLAATFLVITCICHGDPIRANQNAILKYLFGIEKDDAAGKEADAGWVFDPAVRDMCVCHFKMEKGSKTISVKRVLRNAEGTVRWITLEDLFGESIVEMSGGVEVAWSPEKKKREAEKKEMQEYVVGSVQLYANLCNSNRDAQVEIAQVMPQELVQTIIMEPKPGCEDLRGACCDLLYRLYIDADGNLPVMPTALTRKFEEIEPEYANTLVLRDDYPLPEIKKWVVEFLSANVTPVAALTKIKLNRFVVAVIDLVMRLLQFGMYTQVRELEDVMRPLIAILDGTSDIPDAEDVLSEAGSNEKVYVPGREWRFSELPKNEFLIEAKLKICNILVFVQDVRLNLRMTRILLVFRAHLDKLRSRKAEPNTYNETQICKYIVKGSPLLSATGQWKSMCSKISEMKEIFRLVDFDELYHRKIDRILMDLTQYSNPMLVTAASRVLMNQYSQRKNLAYALTEVQLLCSKTDIGFYSDAQSMKSALEKFMKTEQNPDEERACKDKLLQATEHLLKVKTQEELAAKQQLFRNVKFPEQVINILRLGLRDKDMYRPEDLMTSSDASGGIQRRDLTRVPMFRAAYGFLRLCCKRNNDIKETLASRENFAMYIEHLDKRAKTPPGQSQSGGSQRPIMELGAGGLVQELFFENQKLVQAIRPEQIKKFVSLIVNNGRLPGWLRFLEGVVVVKNKNDDKLVPVKRNQQLAIKALIQNKSKTMTPALYKNPEEWATCVELMEKRDIGTGSLSAELQYHIHLVDLLYKCAQGKNKAAEQLCQAEVPLHAIQRGLCDPKTIPVVKEVYLNFLWESYIELERPKKATPTSKEIWACLKRLADDLANSQLNMISGSNDGDWMVSEIQYLYRAALPFLTKWFKAGAAYSYDPSTWDHVSPEEKQELQEIATSLFDGVCTLLEKPADPSCQIKILDTEAGYTCAMVMMNAGVTCSNDSRRALAKSFSVKGKELMDKVDQFKVKAGMPPKPALIQMALGLFAKDFNGSVTEEEEMLGIAAYFRSVLAGEEKSKLLYGDDTINPDNPDMYIRALVRQIETCVALSFDGDSDMMMKFKHKIGLTMRLMVDEVALPFDSGNSKKDMIQNLARRVDMQNRFCEFIDMPDMIITVLAKQDPPVEDQVAADILNLFYYLVHGGNKRVQKAFVGKLKNSNERGAVRVDLKRTERFFNALELRIMKGVSEAKTSRNFYQQKTEQLAEKQRLIAEELMLNPEKPDKTLVAIDAAREPPEETFAETACIEQILMVMQELCEDNFQDAKELLALQPGTDMNHNLCRAAVQYMDIWQKNMGAHNIHLGKKVFATLTELVIGPCRTNQQDLAVELKIDTINELLDIDYDNTDCDLIEMCNMQRRCVQLLQAMLEGCSVPSAESNRVVKALSDMKPISDTEHKLYGLLKDNIIMIYEEYQSHQGFVKWTLNKIRKRRKFDPLRLTLGFQCLTLLRQLHDCMDDPKRSAPFFQEMMKSYKVTATQKDERKSQEIQYNAANLAFQFFLKKMGRIEICRYRGDPNLERIERVYFEIPSYCLKLTEESKEAMKWDIDRNSDEERQKDFIGRADRYQAEMNLQRSLAKYPIYQFFDLFREEWKSVAYYSAFMINAILMLGVDHEDKFKQDPRVDLDGQQGTPFNVMDVYEYPLVGWKQWEVYNGKAYIWQQAAYGLYWLGWVLVVLATITWVLFVLGFGPLIARERFKANHEAEQSAHKEDDPNYELQQFDFESKKGSRLYRPIFYLKWLSYVSSDGRFLYLASYLAISLVGHYYSPFCYSVLLLDILKREEELASAMEAITKPISKIMKTLILAVIIMYIYTVISFAFFHEQFNDGDAKEDNMCNSVLQCLLFTMYNGLISSELWFAMGPNDLWPYQKYGVQQDAEVRHLVVFVIRVVVDITFFLIVGVTLIGGVLFGIILDNFTEIRDTKDSTILEHTNTCFICVLPREEFDRSGNGFNTHVHDDHNMWTYIFFIVYLVQSESTETNGPEAFVTDRLLSGQEEGDVNIDWLPRYDALVLTKQKPDDSAFTKLNHEINKVKKDLLEIKASASSVKSIVNEMLDTAKIIEQQRRQAGNV